MRIGIGFRPFFRPPFSARFFPDPAPRLSSPKSGMMALRQVNRRRPAGSRSPSLRVVADRRRTGVADSVQQVTSSGFTLPKKLINQKQAQSALWRRRLLVTAHPVKSPA
jgi:hypothetical protein